jgi:hypothetical protein
VPTLRTLENSLNRTFRGISAELERKATEALWKLAKSHPTEPVYFCSAMGTYNFTIGKGPQDKDVKPPVYRTFERIEGDYGWNAIPVVWLKIEDGKLERKLDW